jgi:hypothetical protein
MAKCAQSKRNRLTSILFIVPGLLFLLAIISLNLINPLETHAHPQYGFTPQPPPPPPPGGDDSDRDSDEDDSDQPPSHDVTIQLENCNLSCSTGAPLASVFTNNPLLQTAGPGSYSPVSSELLAHVQLIHQGSGWIAEGIISDAKAVSFPVPYPGQWQVFLLEAPELATGEALELTGADVEMLQASLSQAPLLLGVVEADTGEPQQVACPLNCPTAAADFTPAPAPAALPETGAGRPSVPLLPFIGSGILWLLAYLAYQRYRAALPVYAPIVEIVPAHSHTSHKAGKIGDTTSERSDS